MRINNYLDRFLTNISQRKVKFPTEFDALDLASEELKTRLLPVSRRLKEIEKERAERSKIRKRTKPAAPSTSAAAPPTATPSTTEPTAIAEVEMQDDTSATRSAAEGGELQDERVYREKELAELEALIDEQAKNDVGSSVSGLYELVGKLLYLVSLARICNLLPPAIITHKGPAADAGHYMGYVKKSVFHRRKGSLAATATAAPAPGTSPAPTTSPGATDTTVPRMEIEDDDEDWYKFDDEKVSVFPKEKLGTLDGGGEDSSAYVLLYKSKPLA